MKIKAIVVCKTAEMTFTLCYSIGGSCDNTGGIVTGNRLDDEGEAD
jgi:hypothetical protein